MVQSPASRISYTRKASIALDTLPSRERKKVLATIAGLDRPQDEITNSREFVRLNIPGEVYITHVGAVSGLRVIFELTPEGVRVLDIVYQETLDEFRRSLTSTEAHV
jgi:hypothetical protein